jgi:hypothetical protein
MFHEFTACESAYIKLVDLNRFNNQNATAHLASCVSLNRRRALKQSQPRRETLTEYSVKRYKPGVGGNDGVQECYATAVR